MQCSNCGHENPPEGTKDNRCNECGHLLSDNQVLSDNQENKVGGWLAFLCVSFILFNPGFTILNFVISFKVANELFSQYPQLMIITVIDTILSFGVMFYSIYAGICLVKIKPNAVKTAKTFLLTFISYSFIASVLPFIAGLPSQINEAMFPIAVQGFSRSSVYFAIWYTYLNQSKRVKATYRIK